MDNVRIWRILILSGLKLSIAQILQILQTNLNINKYEKYDQYYREFMNM